MPLLSVTTLAGAAAVPVTLALLQLGVASQLMLGARTLFQSPVARRMVCKVRGGKSSG
ncbi:MAG: hypothetical protein FWC38_08435 [Proteobacteria bacterium]|nr:hypothetical protein [Pseudomonadota bacterium]